MVKKEGRKEGYRAWKLAPKEGKQAGDYGNRKLHVCIDSNRRKTFSVGISVSVTVGL